MKPIVEPANLEHDLMRAEQKIRRADKHKNNQHKGKRMDKDTYAVWVQSKRAE